MVIPVETIIAGIIMIVAILILFIGSLIMLGSFWKGLQAWMVAGMVGAIGLFWLLNPIIDPLSTDIAEGLKCSWGLYQETSIDSAQSCLNRAEERTGFPTNLILWTVNLFMKPVFRLITRKGVDAKKTNPKTENTAEDLTIEEPTVKEVPETLKPEELPQETKPPAEVEAT